MIKDDGGCMILGNSVNNRMYDVGDYIFTFGLFFTLFFLFAIYLPVVNMAEVKAVLKSSTGLFKVKVRTGLPRSARTLASPAA